MTGPEGAGAEPSESIRSVPIRDEMIRLGQFLKLADLIDAGSDARRVCSSGAVLVNDEPETRRGRQLHRGDRVRLGGTTVRVG